MFNQMSNRALSGMTERCGKTQQMLSSFRVWDQTRQISLLGWTPVGICLCRCYTLFWLSWYRGARAH